MTKCIFCGSENVRCLATRSSPRIIGATMPRDRFFCTECENEFQF